MSSKKTLLPLLPLVVAATMASCSDEVDQAPAPVPGTGAGGLGGSGGSGGAGGVGGQPPPPPLDIEQIAAPDEYTVTIRFNTEPAAPSLDALPTYPITSNHGDLEVTGASFDPATLTATLTTDRQKLGVEYDVVLTAPGEPVDGLGGAFLAADTAKFWAADFGSPTYQQYELVADRAGVGEHCVMYVEQGESVSKIGSSIATFDEEIFPIETELFIDAPDEDGNGRIVLLGLDGGGYYGGYFSPINTFDDEDAMKYWGQHSNEMELLYINVAYMGGFDMDQVTPHEFQHLLYNERHGLEQEYFAYHDEGLAESAVRAVHGSNDYAVNYYLMDPSGNLGKGTSLVDWQVANYDQYALAYMFWAYVAAQLDGVETYGLIFDTKGDPLWISDLLESELGTDMMTTYRNMLLATWVQDPSGPYGFEQWLELPTKPAQVPSGMASVNLKPFAGAFFYSLPVDQVDYPGTQGPHILYAGINQAGEVDTEAPFDIAGGALLALNANFEWSEFTPEHSGPDIASANGPSQPGPAKVTMAPPSPAWLDPPPVHPAYHEHLRRWQKARERYTSPR